jgi:hypothetical protein
MEPELIVPRAVTVIVLLAVWGTAEAKFPARMPTLPELMMSPVDVLTATFPVPFVNASIP